MRAEEDGHPQPVRERGARVALPVRGRLLLLEWRQRRAGARDLLAVLGLIIATKGLRFVPAAAIVWHMSLACNQSKMATIAVLICIYGLARLQQWTERPKDWRNLLAPSRPCFSRAAAPWRSTWRS